MLEIVATGSGRAGVDFISLMAEDDRAAGMTRKDLREGVEALRPTFIRFPGGSHASHYHWKDAIGPPHLRPYVLNESWDYHIYNLLGTDEFMNLCKHLKAEPMIVFNATEHSVKDIDQRTVPLLDDALDWVHYLTDPPTGKWGAMRAANGRREPWSVPYFQIDNEPMNFGMDGTAYAKLINRWSPSIRAAAPKSQIIACGQKRDPDLAFSKQVIDGAGANFEILGVHNYEYTESAYFTGVRRIGNYLRDLRLTGSQVSADAVVRIREIASSLTAECTAEQPALFEPRESSAKNSGGLVHELAPHSVAVIEFRNP